MFTIEFCKTKKGYEAKPQKQVRFRLKELENCEDFEVITDAKIAIVGRIDGQEILIQSYGNILFKTLDVESSGALQKAEKIAKKIYEVCLG